MEWLFALLGACALGAATRIGEVIVDTLLAAWRNRRPRNVVTDVPWRSYLQRRFRTAAIGCAVESALTGVLLLLDSPILAAFTGIAAVLLFASAIRRWRRLRDPLRHA